MTVLTISKYSSMASVQSNRYVLSHWFIITADLAFLNTQKMFTLRKLTASSGCDFHEFAHHYKYSKPDKVAVVLLRGA
jgi:hypothetical protein